MEYEISRMTPTDELYHYGVKGMKWGVRRFQDKSGRLTAKGRQRYKYDASSGYDDNSDHKKTNDKFHLTDRQKKAIKIGAAVAVTALATYGTYRLARTGKLNTFINKGKEIAGGFDSDLFDGNTGLKLQNTKQNIDKNLKAINPKFNPLNPKYSMNCGNCTIAAELRMRGYDVEALGNPTGMQISHFGEFFKNLKSESFVDMYVDNDSINKIGKSKAVRDTIVSNLSNKYNGDARGALFFPHTMGNHFIYWTKNGNNIHFHDGQNPKMNMDKLFDMYKNFSDIHSIRLDDLEINTDNIRNAVKNVGDTVTLANSDNFDTYVNKGKNFVMRWL